MRRLLMVLAVALIPSLAAAHGHGGGGGGHIGGGWGGHSAAGIAGGARMGAGHGRVFFVGGPWWGGYGYYDSGCWQWVPTRWGPQRIWVCGSYY
jgi:hypothetical protein